ncbi:MAG: DUF3108 domain-containing protein [FCB group bacterium]|nr:DUF3108 domain-containing protein [FCB group bacterium]MBL7027722.1 DUF3108 domain-containing protein [Candidatus Neomarinimicrobiota bacterium]MBL7121031.1 DUF3108 domain-containing protein [Candidatus Neomarinimicrobiota bacterium]
MMNKILLFVLLLFATGASAQTYSYKVKYGLVHAGMATLIHTVEDDVLNSFFVIESSPWLSTLWTLSDSVMTEYLIDVGRLVKHTKAIHEGAYHRNYEVTFSDSNLATVNGMVKEIEIKGLRDIPSLLYDLSLTKFHHGDTLQYRMWDGRGSGKLTLLVEKVGKPSLFKPFEKPGWRLTPLNSTRKSRANQIQLSMFYSKSYPHTPLKIEIDTKYGSVQMRIEDP